jgi:hypothetical protein
MLTTGWWLSTCRCCYTTLGGYVWIQHPLTSCYQLQMNERLFAQLPDENKI